ncbi:hypothetical protein OBO34_07030 [Clostridiales Family XIII bacterium ASD5510]|uniref:AP2 domain-containing protein n=1 Tax=Hominibacterium faecale TaxID=2839743 RepID=A0A9J6QQ30_9FIRM|nr:hypothetical protein [Hominibacterium faecale]MCU7378106.1 hypothetical protein [Hominibacterium faecale]
MNKLLPRIEFVKRNQIYRVAIYHDGVRYSLGHHKDAESAREVQSYVTEALRNCDDFLKWYATNYPSEWKRKVRKFKGCTNVPYNENRKRYMPTITVDGKQYILGYFVKYDEALEVQVLAETAKKDGVFLEWLDNHKKARLEKDRKNCKGIHNGTAPGTYKANISVNNISYYLGQYDSLEAAMQIRLQAEEAKQDGIFTEWFAKNFSDRWEKMQRKKSGEQSDEKK